MTSLTPEQRRNAEALGRRLVPAPAPRIATLSMQRRVFRIDGQAFLVARADGFFETAATLQHLLQQPRPDPSGPAAPPADAPVAAPASSKPGRRAVPAAAPRLKSAEAGGAAIKLGVVVATAPASRPLEGCRPDLAETARLVSACLSAQSVPLRDLEALIRGTHQAVLRVRALG